MNKTYRLSGWDYTLNSIDPMKFSVKPSIDIVYPNELMKYYRISEYSVDSFINNYFYASHPYELNDPFDCFEGLINFENVTLETYKRFFCTYTKSTEEKIEELYNTDIDKLKRYFKPQLNDFLLSKIGIISLTCNQLNMLMWAHYSNHSGFMTVYDVPGLERQFHGPFPINYIDKADSFDINENPHLSVLYLTNIKSNCWSYENEWRLIAESPNPMKLPHRFGFPNLVDRKFPFPKETLKEVVLGFNFFDYNSIVEKRDDFIIADFKDLSDCNLRIKVLEHIISSDLIVSMIHLYDNLEFKLAKKEIVIEKFDKTIYGFKIKHVA